MGIAFWCAGCGQPLAADDADAGREVECVKCRAVVRVPRNPVPPTADNDNAAAPLRPAPTFAVADSGTARAGIRLVGLSFWLFLIGAAAVGAVAAYDLGSSTPVPDRLRITVGWIGIVILVIGGLLRVVGYARCRPVGHVLEMEWALTCAMIGAVLLSCGLAALLITEFIANPLHSATRIVGLAGLVASLSGLAAELVVLAFFRTLLGETRDSQDAGQVKIYLLLLVVAGIAAPMAWVAYVTFTAIAGMIRSALIGNPAWLPIPPEVLFAWLAGGTAGLVLLWQIVLQYTRILSRSRAGLVSSANPESPP